ncbi:MAG: hypothetical protein FJ146_11640 [Deltaproteobacteria bacterium]|nr:hypothetical protein [Deltaproteobacteria bacterium]
MFAIAPAVTPVPALTLGRSCLMVLGLMIMQLQTGCSSGDERRPSDNGGDPLTTGVLSDSAYAAQYFVADSDCQASNEGPILAGKGIGVSYYNFYQRTTCQSQSGSDACDDGEVVNSPEHLRICPATKSFPRNSVEGVGRTALANVGTASKFYDSIPTASTTLPHSALLVLPRIETVYKDSSKVSVTVDNLAYAPNFRGMPTFVIYPKGSRSVREGRWVNVNFWEVPWAIAHEFGHHVFNNHSGVSGSTQGIFKDLPLYGSTLGIVAGEERQITNDDLLVAVNEGFADIFAYYTLGGDPGVTSSLDCFQKSRDTGSATFADGTEKILSQEVLSAFTASRTLSSPSTCQSPSFQEVHAIGAIIAYGVDQVFQAALPATQSLNAEREKGRLLLVWAQKLGRVFRTLGADSSGGKNNLAKLILEAMKAAAPNGTMAAAGCQAVRKYFPVYATTWFRGDLTCQQ